MNPRLLRVFYKSILERIDDGAPRIQLPPGHKEVHLSRGVKAQQPSRAVYWNFSDGLKIQQEVVEGLVGLGEKCWGIRSNLCNLPLKRRNCSASLRVKNFPLGIQQKRPNPRFSGWSISPLSIKVVILLGDTFPGKPFNLKLIDRHDAGF